MRSQSASRSARWYGWVLPRVMRSAIFLMDRTEGIGCPAASTSGRSIRAGSSAAAAYRSRSASYTGRCEVAVQVKPRGTASPVESTPLSGSTDREVPSGVRTDAGRSAAGSQMPGSDCTVC